MAVDFTTLLDKLNPDPGGESTIRTRTGTVNAVNANGTLDILMSSGVIIPNVNKLANAHAPLNSNVQMISQRGGLLVLGAVGLSSGGASPGRANTTVRTSDTSAVTAETVADTVTANLVIGATYKVRWTPSVISTVAGDTLFMRLRENNLVGTQLQILRVHVPTTGGSGTRWPAELEAEYTALSTGAKTFVGTYARASGTGNVSIHAAATFPVYLYVDYVRG